MSCLRESNCDVVPEGEQLVPTHRGFVEATNRLVPNNPRTGFLPLLPLTTMTAARPPKKRSRCLALEVLPPDKLNFMAQIYNIYRDSPPRQRGLPQRIVEPSTDRAAQVSRASRAAAAAGRAFSTGSSSSSSCRPTFSSSTGSRAVDGTTGPSGDVCTLTTETEFFPGTGT